MDILKVIKERKTIRKYKDKPIPKEIIEKIIEAGRWGPSVIGLQPWEFVFIETEEVLDKIIQKLKERLNDLETGGRFVLHSSILALSTAQTVLFVYNTNDFVRASKKFGENYSKFTRLSEIEAISAGIQNMILVAEELGIGSAWLDAPVMFSEDIKNILKIDRELVSILTFGYPDESGSRTKRKKIEDVVKYI
ncbi:MAG: nitroreductase family protein [Candidatus Omnitrophica bacterium]|nr:nitroreductase family protein [Candidatus Omnitrophota bacterium]